MPRVDEPSPLVERPPAPPIVRAKTRTERVDDALKRVLEEEGADEIIKKLKPEEQALFWDLVGMIRDGKIKDVEEVQSDLWKVDFTRKPPTIEEFTNDHYWLGQVLETRDDNPGIFPIWRQILYSDFNVDSRIHNVVFTGSLGIGKCHKAGDTVLMYDGTIKNVEDVKVGDRLMGDDSRPRIVLRVAQGSGPLYTIRRTGAKGRPPVCHVNLDHVLCLQNTYSGEVVDISVRDWLLKGRKFRQDFKLYKVSVSFRHCSVKIDPYWLGLWLGDGSWHECSIASVDQEILDYHTNYAHSRGLHVKPRQTKKPNLKCLAAVGSKKKANSLLNDLRFYGLATSYKSQDKFVPTQYLANSKEVRLQLLAGLIDADGHYCNTPGCYGGSFKSERLAKNLCQLANSLGYDAWCRPVVKTIKSRGFSGTYWRWNISNAHDIPVRLLRKRSLSRRIRKTGVRHGFTIAPDSIGTWYGFELDGNHRYLLSDCTPNHNTYTMCSVFLYRLALTRLLRNPQNFFGLGRGSLIFYAILSLTRAVVRDTAFGEVMNFMGHSPFFKEECHFNPDAKYSDGNIEMGNQLVLKAGSKGWHLIGRNVMGVCLDEGNYRLEANPDEKAYQLYDEVRTRIQNRFQKLAGYLPAISILASSARDESSFTERVIKDIKNAHDDATQKVYSFAVYHARRHLLTLRDRWFKVAYGLKNVDPVVLGGWYKEDGTPIIDEEEPHEDPPLGAMIELVPEDYHDAFVRDTRTALMNVAGKSVGGSHRLFSSMVNIYRCIELSVGLKNPCTTKIIPLSREDDRNIWDYLTHNLFLTRRESRVVPLYHPEALRFVHLDLASTGKAGLGICHRAGSQLVHDIRDGEPFDEMRMIIQYDFILTIGPGKNQPISLEKVQRFLFWLRDKCNFRFGLVTADQWNSVLPLEMLSTRGFTTKQLSLDRSKGPYLSWKSGFDDLRIRLFEQEMMLEEAEKLKNIESQTHSSDPTSPARGKIDHPIDGSKDTTDGAAGAYYNAITSDIEVGFSSASQVGMHLPNASEVQEEKPLIDIPTTLPVRPGSEVTFNA